MRMHEGRGVCDDACVCEWACTGKGVVCLMMHACMNGCVCTRVLHVIIETEALLFNACARNK